MSSVESYKPVFPNYKLLRQPAASRSNSTVPSLLMDRARRCATLYTPEAALDTRQAQGVKAIFGDDIGLIIRHRIVRTAFGLAACTANDNSARIPLISRGGFDAHPSQDTHIGAKRARKAVF